MEVFPENWEAVSVFQQLRTQWNTGVNGATGLNYLVMLAWIARLNLSKEDEGQLIFDLQILEISALNAMRGGTLDV